ncbi:putative peroxiredoxin bcp [Anoxybacillus sp. BCO1]|nr:putative peroxiredoxin bcp [Anoxybacillus sp. BCO1]
MKAPDFTLPASNGENVTLSQFHGKYVVLYFYPKDMTPGCTTEACEFRDHHEVFEELGAVVIGISLIQLFGIKNLLKNIACRFYFLLMKNKT